MFHFKIDICLMKSCDFILFSKIHYPLLFSLLKKWWYSLCLHQPLHPLGSRRPRRWWWQWKCQKTKRSTKLNINFACASGIFVHSLPSLHYYSVQMANVTFYCGCKQAMTNFSFMSAVPNKSTPGKLSYIWHFTVNWDKLDKVWKKYEMLSLPAELECGGLRHLDIV